MPDSVSSALVLYISITISSVVTGTGVSDYGNNITTTAFPQSNSRMPHGWSPMCSEVTKTSKTIITISCHVTIEDTWNFNDFRNWSSKLDSDTLVTLEITCGEGGVICLPWPYRAARLDTLKVKDCIDDCFFSDYSQPEFLETIPDSLRVFEAFGMTVKASIFDLLSINMSNLPPVLDCGPLLTDIYIYRGGKNIFYLPDGVVLPPGEDVTNSLSGKVRDLDDLKHECRYENMRVYDVSQRVDSSTSFLYAALVNSQYPQLRTLNLSQTELQTFPVILTVWRRKFDKLEVLDLSYNNISRFDLRDLSLTTQEVGRIILKNNNIRTIGMPEIRSFKNVDGAVIELEGNPLECNCAMANFSHYLQKHSGPKEAGIYKNYSYLWDLKCTFPPSLEGKRIVDMTRVILCSTDVTSFIAQISVLSVVVVLLLIVIILMARYRKEMRILVFTRLHIVLPCEPPEPSCKKIYDAFVAYSHLDTTWVVKTLLPRLENGPGIGGNFRLCLHQRDFEVGAAIADNIVQSVEASRHTILVLSKKFLQSEWCLMEFRTAFHQSLIEKKKHLILVLLEDIPPDDLDADLRRCMQTWTYIHIADRLFWDRIIYSLTDKSKSRWKLFHRRETEQVENGETKGFEATSKDIVKVQDTFNYCFDDDVKDSFTKPEKTF